MMQLFIMVAMLNIVYPALLMYFYQIVVSIAEVDIFKGPEYYEKYFNFKQTPKFSLKFEFFGMGDMNFFMNLASIPICFCFIFVNYFIWKIISLISRMFYRFKIFRIIGMYVEPKIVIRYGIIKIFTETYIEIVLSSILMIIAICF